MWRGGLSIVYTRHAVTQHVLVCGQYTREHGFCSHDAKPYNDIMYRPTALVSYLPDLQAGRIASRHIAFWRDAKSRVCYHFLSFLFLYPYEVFFLKKVGRRKMFEQLLSTESSTTDILGVTRTQVIRFQRIRDAEKPARFQERPEKEETWKASDVYTENSIQRTEWLLYVSLRRTANRSISCKRHRPGSVDSIPL